MAKKLPDQNSQSPRPSAEEAYILGRVANGEVPVSGLIEGLGSQGHTTDESVRAIRALQSGNRVVVQEPRPFATLGAYALSPLSLWFWGALGAVALSLGLITVTSGFALYLRYVFGSILVLFLPGYSLIEALYPKRELDELTRFALSIGLSLALVPLTGLVLNYTPFGIRLVPVAISLGALTAVLLAAALWRKHAYYKLAKGVT